MAIGFQIQQLQHNHRLKTSVRSPYPDIFASIELFREEENEAQFIWFGALNGEKAPYRRSKSIIDDETLASFKSMLRSREIRIDTYIKYVSQKFSLEKIHKTVAAETIVSSSDEE